ncbi:MAG: flagellar brake protein [Nitrospira sp.]|nr:flagellar brake protein [Nitrospira sp.]
MKKPSDSGPSSSGFLAVGLPVKLSLVMEGRKVVHGSTLLGWKEPAWLICQWPSQLDWVSGLAENTPCTLSYLRDGKLVGCRTEIRGAVATPVPLLFLAYPRQVEEMHLRQYPRVSSNEPAVVSRIVSRGKDRGGIAPADHVGGLVKDLSIGGCRLALERVPSWVRIGSSIHLEFELPGVGHDGDGQEHRQGRGGQRDRRRVPIRQDGIHRVSGVGRFGEAGDLAMDGATE